MIDLIQYLKDMKYPASVIKDAEQLHIVFKAELSNLLDKFDFEDYFICFMIECPESISTVRYLCENSGGVPSNFMEEWKKYHINIGR